MTLSNPSIPSSGTDTSISDKVQNCTLRKIKQLQALSGTSQAVRELAFLRRGVGKLPGEIPEIWGLFLADMEGSLLGKTDVPSNAESAVYNALTLFALHQQGKDLQQECCHQRVPLGKAAAMLVDLKDESSQSRILFRLKKASLAPHQQALATELRFLIQLMKQKSISIDYGLLAKDFYLFSWPENRNAIRLRWARDFFSEMHRRTKTSPENDE